jgi:hypothetical protein
METVGKFLRGYLRYRDDLIVLRTRLVEYVAMSYLWLLCLIADYNSGQA